MRDCRPTQGFLAHGALALMLALTLLRPALGDGAAAGAITGPAGEMNTWLMGAGSAEGFTLGDRVRIERAGKPVCEGVVFEVKPHAAKIVVTSTAGGVRRGDSVVFARKRPPPPPDPPRRSPPDPPAPSGSELQSVPTSRPASESAVSAVPGEWFECGTMPGLLGNDWLTRHTRRCFVFVRKSSLGERVNALLATVDQTCDDNEAFLGIPAPRVRVFVLPASSPIHVQPRFSQSANSYKRFAGITEPDGVFLNEVLPETGQPVILARVARHEVNHAFLMQPDPGRAWHWFLEGLAYYFVAQPRPSAEQMRLLLRGTPLGAQHLADLGEEYKFKFTEAQYSRMSNLFISVIVFLQDRYGQDVIQRIARESRRSGLGPAIESVCGKKVSAIEAEWKRYYEFR